ncbi:MAG: methionyl-tRNA formyltransferase [Synergistaceae bacterium]|nr:methionyl-tRNA formyltransferase [Synergistaceae bacterium]
MSYAFFGAGSFSARCLELLSAWKRPLWVVTSPPAASGRGGRLSSSPLGRLIAESGVFRDVPVFETRQASSDERVLDAARSAQVDVAIVTDFGQVIREPILSCGGRMGCVNIHPSLLPKYRGAAPVQRALMDCRSVTGVTLFKLIPAMDSGPVLLRMEIEIGDADDAGTLLERAAVAGVGAFVEYAETNGIDEWNFTPQDELAATYAPKISAEEERIDWKRPANEIFGLVRALSPKPGAWTTMRGKRLRVLGVGRSNAGLEGKPGELTNLGGTAVVICGHGSVSLRLVQAEGRKIQNAAEWWNGLRAGIGECMI